MKGTRLPNGFEWTSKGTPHGAYWLTEQGTWMVQTPNGRLGSIAKHQVVEHEDGTITVSPSILVSAIEGRRYDVDERARLVETYGEPEVQDWERGRPEWHGFLERGVWRSC